MDPSDPADQTRTLYRENLWLRQLLVRVAQDLEHVAVLEQYRHRPATPARAAGAAAAA